ncbi:hypothetical protein CR513_31018, partial [Mucuna pruriens]
MWPLSSQKKSSSTTVKMQQESGSVAVPTKSVVSTCHCCCLVTKLMRKLKRRRGRTLQHKTASTHGSFQCRYDPLSYSLNFDTTGCGTLMDEDYYKFVANPTTTRDPPLTTT